jgi:hypothetical protein
VAEEYRWSRLDDNTGGGAVTLQPMTFHSLDFNWTRLYKMKLTICILNSDLRKIRLAPDLPERNCVSPGVSVSGTKNMPKPDSR